MDLDDLESIAAADDSAMVVDAPTAAAAGAPTSGRIGRKNNNSGSTTATTSATIADAKPASGDVPPPAGHYVHLLNRPMAGQALGDMKVTSFDIVAGAVTAPNLRQQSSFDGAYLPTPSDDFGSYFSRNNTNNSIHSNSISANAGLATKPSVLNNSTVVPSGRVFLSTGDGQGGRTGSSSSVGAGGSGGGLPLGAAAGGAGTCCVF